MQGAELLVPAHLEVAWIPYEKGGAYPGIFLYSGPARMVRPVLQLPAKATEHIGTLEQINMHIRCGPALCQMFACLFGAAWQQIICY